LSRCNEAANLVSGRAFERKIFGKRDLQQVCYGDAKALLPGAQAVVRTIGKVCDAYKTLKANIKAGNLGKKDSRKYIKATSKPVTFRQFAAHPFDDRMLSWDIDSQTASIWTLGGRQKIKFVGQAGFLDLLRRFRKGETDLVRERGQWFLMATLNLPDVPEEPVQEFIGVDLGIAQIAVVADQQGNLLAAFGGGQVTERREKNRRMRRRLQTKHTKSANRLLKKRAGKEARFAKDVDHCVSKRVVTEAKRTGKGIAVENLTGIRDRVRQRKPQRVTLHSWSFAQLGGFIAYKALAKGVPLVQVDPAYTSQECSRCGHTEESNRKNQADFRCKSCGVALNADLNAATNIARRGQQTYLTRGAVNHPDAGSSTGA